MRKTITKIIGYTIFFSLFIPFVALKKHHDCHYDECMIIYTEGRCGLCIESMIDSICKGIVILWFFVIMGGAMILNKNRNTISPYIVALLVIIMAIILACMDPSKCEFALSLFPSFILLIIASYIDSKNKITN
ncbi:MAG: hypothetical protein E7083_01415 [Bacteroidales bacterium]|nr:hypothetical protein [Bacteroidales bacterium]